MRTAGYGLRAIVMATCMLGQASPCVAQVGSLVPGADLSDCASALRAGPSACGRPAQAYGHDDPMPSGTQHGLPIGPLERRVDEFLANYGKPPREAVRALLDPSDENIRAMLQAQEHALDIAAYVAARMSELQALEADGVPAMAPLTAAQLAPLARLRVALVIETRDHGADPALSALRALARYAPSVQARIEVIGNDDAPRVRDEVARLAPQFDVVLADPASVAPEALPYVRIDDPRSRRTRVLAASELNFRALMRALLDLTHETGLAPPAPGVSPDPKVSEDRDRDAETRAP